MPADHDLATSDKIDEGISLTNLTRLRWDQQLVASVRLAIYFRDLVTYKPVHTDGTFYSDNDLQALTRKDPDRFDSVKLAFSDKSYITPWQNYLPTLKEDIEQYRLAGNKQRRGAIAAVLLTELGWPVHAVATALGTSRPTVSRWIMSEEAAPLTDMEILDLASWVERARLYDLRTAIFRSRRSGLVWKKATFLPSENMSATMRALWRVGYRVRGEKSPQSSLVCSYTLNMVLDLLSRRGVTALNMARIAGVQPMAVNVRLRNIIEQSDEERGWAYGDPTSEVAAMQGGLIKDDEAVDPWFVNHHRFREHDAPMRAFLLQSRTGVPSEHFPVPGPNVSVLTRLDADASGVRLLQTLDSLPVYDVNRVVADAESHAGTEYDFAAPTFNEARLTKMREELRAALARGENIAEHHFGPFLDETMAALAFDAPSLGYPYITKPSLWEGGSLVRSEMLLAQATMAYDRSTADALPLRGTYGATHNHWVPLETSYDLVDVYPADYSKRELAKRAEAESIDTDEGPMWQDFFPRAHQSKIEQWLIESQTDENGLKIDGNSLLWNCFHAPDKVLATFSAPVSRKKSE